MLESCPATTVAPGRRVDDDLAGLPEPPAKGV